MKSKKMSVLLAKARYLKLELEDCEALNETYKSEFLIQVEINKKKSLSMSSAAKNISDDLSKYSQNNVEPKKNINSDIKKLYKKIMSKVHPDKCILIQDDNLRKEYSSMCNDANKAIVDLDTYILLDIASKLSIEVDDKSGVFKSELENCCSKYSLDISNIKSTYPWIWANSPDSEKRLVVLDYINKKL